MRRGMNVMYDGRPFRVMEIEIRTPGKGRAFVQVKLRSILDGTQRELKLSTAMLQIPRKLNHPTADFLRDYAYRPLAMKLSRRNAAEWKSLSWSKECACSPHLPKY
jgi:hypothetical protein